MESIKRILLPENLNLNKLLEDYQSEYPLRVDNLKYIIGLIYELPADDHRLLASQEDTLYVPLNSQLLKSRIRDYQYYLRYLVEVGVLECDNSYTLGVKSKAYRFTQAYQVKTKVDTLSNPKLVSWNRHQQDKYQEALNLYPHLIHHFKGLEIDYEKAMHYIDQIYEVESNSTDPRVRKKAASRYSAYHSMIINLDAKMGAFVVDSSGHRFHSPLTNLKSGLRQFLTYQGEPLVALDLSSSQPYLATALFRASFYQPTTDTTTIALKDLPKSTQVLLTNTHITTILSYLTSSNSNFNEGNRGIISTTTSNRVLSSISSFSPLSPLCPLMCAAEINNSLSSRSSNQEKTHGFETIDDELKAYSAQFNDGQFYEYLGHQVGLRTGRRYQSREQIKEMVCSVLFSSNDTRQPFIVARKEAFRQVYPKIAGLFELLKQDDHKVLACLLQTIESEIILNRIVRRITEERPEVSLFSIHDSLTTTPAHLSYVEGVMVEELIRATGVVPHLKREKWGGGIKTEVQEVAKNGSTIDYIIENDTEVIWK